MLAWPRPCMKGKLNIFRIYCPLSFEHDSACFFQRRPSDMKTYSTWVLAWYLTCCLLISTIETHLISYTAYCTSVFHPYLRGLRSREILNREYKNPHFGLGYIFFAICSFLLFWGPQVGKTTKTKSLIKDA